jgi:glycosyltransferase involved in cell wall biosynthesis
MSDAPVRVTIGMPVYNGERTIAAALDSLLSQTYEALQLIISDNASTDATGQICKAYAARDRRITYIRQDQNIGADANFEFVLQQAHSEYFMWAAADDTRSADFIDENLRFLQTHPDYVGSTSPVRFVEDSYDPARMGDETRAEEAAGRRILGFLTGWHANGRFYSLFRRRDLVEAKRDVRAYFGSDWTIVVRLLARGKMNRVGGGSVELGRHGMSNSPSIFPTYRTRWWMWLLPLLELQRDTWSAVRAEPWEIRVQIALRLMKYGLLAAATQLAHAIKRAL